jgi:hypothetical protein
LGQSVCLAGQSGISLGRHAGASRGLDADRCASTTLASHFKGWWGLESDQSGASVGSASLGHSSGDSLGWGFEARLGPVWGQSGASLGFRGQGVRLFRYAIGLKGIRIPGGVRWGVEEGRRRRRDLGHHSEASLGPVRGTALGPVWGSSGVRPVWGQSVCLAGQSGAKLDPKRSAPLPVGWPLQASTAAPDGHIVSDCCKLNE